MTQPSNLPPGGGFHTPPYPVSYTCPNDECPTYLKDNQRETWEAYMYMDMGGYFYSDEDKGPYCPVCKTEGET